jgi:hypothetical protein
MTLVSRVPYLRIAASVIPEIASFVFYLLSHPDLAPPDKK